MRLAGEAEVHSGAADNSLGTSGVDNIRLWRIVMRKWKLNKGAVVLTGSAVPSFSKWTLPLNCYCWQGVAGAWGRARLRSLPMDWFPAHP